MPKISSVEAQIERVEHFSVRFRHSGPGRAVGPDVRSDMEQVPGYPYKRAAPGNFTVRAWVD